MTKEEKREYSKRWRKKNKKRIREMRHKYYLKNRAETLRSCKENYKKNQKKLIARGSKWRNENRSKLRKRYRQWYRENPDKVRAKTLKRKFNLSVEGYLKLLEAQGNKCAICGDKPPKQKYLSFSVDHCHKSGEIRGILCRKCNTGIGMLGDSPKLLKSAIKYLTARRKNEP